MIAVIACFVLFLLWHRHDYLADRTRLLQEQFHLPESAQFAQFDPGGDKMKTPSVSGIVRFDEEQFARYLAATRDPAGWKPAALPYRGAANVDIRAPAALGWTDRPPFPRYAGDRMRRWGFRSDEPVAAIRKGRYLCYGVVRIADGEEGQPRHQAVPCAELLSSQEPAAIVKAALDLENRTLHMIVI